MFASKSLIEHVARGAIGAAAIIAAIGIGREPGIIALLSSLGLAAVALIAFRGCPICWTMGLVETARDRFRTR
jgi:hypothetical protein